eukprot:g32615.t1
MLPHASHHHAIVKKSIRSSGTPRAVDVSDELLRNERNASMSTLSTCQTSSIDKENGGGVVFTSMISPHSCDCGVHYSSQSPAAVSTEIPSAESEVSGPHESTSVSSSSCSYSSQSPSAVSSDHVSDEVGSPPQHASAESEVPGSQESEHSDDEGLPPQKGSFVAAIEAEGKDEVAELLARGAEGKDGVAIRAWNLGRVVSAYVDDGVKMLTMFGTDDNKTLTGKYGVARQSKRDGTWRFATAGPKGSAGGQMLVVYTWSFIQVGVQDQEAIEKVLDQLDIPIMQEARLNRILRKETYDPCSHVSRVFSCLFPMFDLVLIKKMSLVSNSRTDDFHKFAEWVYDLSQLIIISQPRLLLFKPRLPHYGTAREDNLKASGATKEALSIFSMSHSEIEYSDKYADDLFEYRHVILPREIAKRLPKPMRLLTETEWRALGVRQSCGWKHYEIHLPEPHILLFSRALGTDPRTGQPPKGWNDPVKDAPKVKASILSRCLLSRLGRG